MTSAQPTGSFVVLFGVVFLSIAGVALIAPLLPLYAVAFGVDGLAVGALLAIYPLMQVLFSPVWGRLSDRLGRRPVLIISLLGATVSFALVGAAGSFPMLLVARLIGGIFAANLATAQAYAVDMTPPDQRARALGLLGAAFGLGFVVGPAIGGLLGQVDLRLPAYAAAALSLVNALAAIVVLPESRARAKATPARPAVRAAMPNRRALAAIVVFGFATLGTSVSHPILPLYAKDTAGFGPAETGLLFAAMGAVSALSQALIVGPLTRTLSEPAVVRVGLALLAGGAVLMTPLTIGLSGLGIVLAMAVITIGEAITAPATTALISRAAPATDQGAILGVAQSTSAGARVVGPLLGAQLLAGFGPYAIFFGCTVIFGMALAVAFRLAHPPVGTLVGPAGTTPGH